MSIRGPLVPPGKAAGHCRTAGQAGCDGAVRGRGDCTSTRSRESTGEGRRAHWRLKMREIFHRELDQLVEQLVEMTRLVDTAMYRATTALLDADLALAESVIAADAAVDGFHRDLDERALELIARQQPVAGDLRTILASLRMSADLERMGDLARHVAELARLRYPRSPVPPELRSEEHTSE